MKLKTLRETNNITQEKLAEDLGVEVKTIQRWEKGVPPLRDLLLLSKHFDVYPQELLDDNESMPHFRIGNSGSIDVALVKNNVLVSLRILSSDNVMNDIYRNTSIEYTDEMKEDILNISLKLTNLYSRMVFSLYTKKWINLLPTENVARDKNNDLYLEFCAIDLFHSEGAC